MKGTRQLYIEAEDVIPYRIAKAIALLHDADDEEAREDALEDVDLNGEL